MKTSRLVLSLLAGGMLVSLVFAQPISIAPTSVAEPAPDVVSLANAYISTLSATQQSATVMAYTAANAAKWSNLPAQPGSAGTTSLRNGVSYSSLTAAQQAAWSALVAKALGAGLNRESQVRAADNYLGTLNSGYSGNYQYVAFCGTPSTTGAWIMQVGGHHNAHNLYFVGSALQTYTPYHIAVEPGSAFTYGGATYQPLLPHRTAMYNMINSLTSTQLSTAHLTTSFSDIYLGPGRDARSNFPTGTTNRGILGSALTSAQKNLVKTAIAAWVSDCPEGPGYQALYESELDQTYVAYSGTAALSSQGDYVRIDGPHCWIELACQGGIVIQGQIHYHTVWRDRLTDYGAQFYN